MPKYYGWIPSRCEESIEKPKQLFSSNKLPRKVELKMTGIVYDQLKLNSCTANALASLIEYEQKKSFPIPS